MNNMLSTIYPRIIPAALLALIFLCFNISTLVASNDAPLVSCQGNINLLSQADVDNFGSCEIYTGGIVIKGNDITNLDALLGLKIIDGVLSIFDCPLLTNLSGLDSLHTLTSLLIERNDDLQDLSGLSNLTAITHGLLITDNSSLKTLNGLGALQNIKEYLTVGNNTNLIGIQDLNQLVSIGRLDINNNLRLKDLAGLNSLTKIRIGISIFENDSLISIQELNQVDSLLFGSLDIHNNPQLPNIDGLDQLKYVGQVVTIYGNDELVNVDGLQNLNYVGLGFSIQQNPMLSNCCGIYNILDSGTIGGNISIYGNPALCSSPSEVIASCNFDPCVGEFKPTSQAEVDAFGPCTVYDGNIIIEDPSIQNLNALSGLEEITNVLVIRGAHELDDITGLSSLKKVGPLLLLNDLPLITDLLPLSHLDSVSTLFEMVSMPQLKNLEGLGNLKHVGGLLIKSNDALQSLHGLSTLRSIGINPLTVENNPLLQNLDGLNNLEEIYSGKISNNEVLENLDGLKNLRLVGSPNIVYSLNINDNPLLSNCCGIYDLINNNGVGTAINIANNMSFCNSVDEILSNCGNTSTGVDLELNLTANPIDPLIYTNTVLSLEVTNTGTENASNIVIDFPVPAGYAFVSSSKTSGHFNSWPNGVWNIPKLQAGQSATLMLTIFALTEDPITVFAQVVEQTEDDIDSTPDNNDCLNTIPVCTVVEDDEVLLVLNGSNAPLLLPDLVVESLSGPDIAEAGETYYYNFTLINQGTATDPSDFFTTAYLSTNNQWSSDDLHIGQLVTNGTPLDSLTDLILSIDLPAGQIPGDYFLILKTDSEEVIPELVENNNTSSIALSITYPNAANCQGDTIIKTQAEMDAFGPCVVYDGSIYISEEVNDLSSLAQLQEVKGDLGFINMTSSFDLTSLSNLQKVNGNMVFAQCDSLQDIFNLENLTYVEKQIVIINNDDLEFISGLNNLTEATAINIHDNPNLKSISGFNEISTLTDELQIYENQLLESIDGFNNLNQIGNYLIIATNDTLKSLAGFQSLSSVRIFGVIGNENLESLHGLENLSSIGYGFNIYDNLRLTDCCAIRDLISTPGAITGPINIYDNPAFCSSAQDIIDNCSASDPDLELSVTSNQVDYAPWQIISVSVEVVNTGGNPATDVLIDFPLPLGTVFAGGNEYSASQGTYTAYGSRQWQVGDLQAGATAMITFNLFTSQSNFLLAYAEVESMNELDADSTPGNGDCQYNDPANCQSNEDDEALLVLQSTSNRETAKNQNSIAPIIRSLFPNPTNDQINLMIESGKEGAFVLEIYNTLGKLEQRETLDIVSGINRKNLSVNELSAGTYFLVLVDGHRRSRLNSFIKIGL